MHKNRLAMASVFMVAALLAGGVSTPAMADDSSHEGELFVVMTGTQSIADGMAAQAAKDPEYRREAIALTESWLTRLETGGTIAGLEGLSVSAKSASTQNEVVSKLHSDLVSGSVTPSAASPTPDVATTSARADGDVSILDVNPNNPNTYDVRGEAGIGFWNGMQLITSGAFCGGISCTETDRFTSNVTVDPGARTTKVSATNTYFPNGGNFGDRHFELWAINSGQLVGNSDTGSLPSSSVDFISSTRPLNNSVLTTAVTQWVYLTPYERYTTDGAKTADALCEADDDNACYY